MSNTVSEQLLELLAESGVTRIYGIAGNSLNHVMEALQADKRLRWVNVRHEESAAFAASAEAQLTGRLAACCGSCGPGNMHLINGLYDAHRSAAPVFALASHVPAEVIGSEYAQETHPTRFFNECTAYRELVSRPGQAARVFNAAMRAAQARPGVGMAVLPVDISAMPVQGIARLSPPPGQPVRALCTPPESEVEKMAQMINSAQRVVFFCGAGCAGARRELVSLAQRVAAPIVYTLRAKDIMEKENPLGIGMTGLIGWGDATHAIHEADLLVLWGTDFPYGCFLPVHGRVIQVDRRAEVLGRRLPVSLGVQGDVRSTARMLAPLVLPDRSDEFLSRSLSRHGKALTQMISDLQPVDDSGCIRPEFLTRLISTIAEPDAVVTVDTGTPLIWCARYFQALGDRRILGSFKHGSMGCALAMAVGAKCACPRRQVIALCGDGGLSMLQGELLTLLQENLAVKICVFNNTARDLVAMQQRFPAGVELHPTDFAAMARALGMKSYRMDQADHAIPIIKSWLSDEVPALLDVTLQSVAEPGPPDTELLQALGMFRSPVRRTICHELDTFKRLLFNRRQK